MSQQRTLLEALQCSFATKESIQACLRRRHVVRNIVRPALHGVGRHQLKLAKSKLLATTIAPIKTTNSMSLRTMLEHCEVAIRFVYCCMEYSELQEPEEGSDEPLTVFPSQQGDEEVIEVAQLILQSLVGVACSKVEKDHESDDDLDADEIYELPLDDASSVYCGRRLCYFLFGCLMQLDRVYTSTRVWLLEPIWKASTDELLCAVSSAFPALLQQTAVEGLHNHLEGGLQVEVQPQSHAAKVLNFFLLQLIRLTATTAVVLPRKVLLTLVQLRGKLGIESSLSSRILQTIRSPHRVIDVDPRDDDIIPRLWYVGKALILLEKCVAIPRNQSTDAMVEELVLRTLPAALTYTTDDDGMSQRLITYHSLQQLTKAPVSSENHWLHLLSRAAHPLSLEICYQVLAVRPKSLLLAASLCVHRQTKPELRFRAAQLLLMAQQANKAATAIATSLREILQRGLDDIITCGSTAKKGKKKKQPSKRSLSTLAPVLLCYRIQPTTNENGASSIASLCRILRGNFLQPNANSCYELSLCLHCAIWLCHQQEHSRRGAEQQWDAIARTIQTACKSIDAEENKDLLLPLLLELLECVGSRIPTNATGLKETISKSFCRLFPLAQADTMTALVEFASTVDATHKGILPKCVPKDCRPLLQCRLNGTVLGCTKTDLPVLRQRHGEHLLQACCAAIPRGTKRTITIDEESYFVSVATPSGGHCWVVLPPGQASMDDIAAFAEQEENEQQILQLVGNPSTTTKKTNRGYHLQLRPVSLPEEE